MNELNNSLRQSPSLHIQAIWPAFITLYSYIHRVEYKVLTSQSVFKNMQNNTGVAPIIQVTQVHNKNSNIQAWSLNVIKVIFHNIRNCS